MNYSGSISRNPGSFRDPSGFVVHDGKRVFRVVNRQAADLFCELESSGLLRNLVDKGLLVETSKLAADDTILQDLQQAFPAAQDILEHRNIGMPIYPAEWTFSMIADAGILTLDIQQALVPHSLALQDASAYNVMFAGSKPVFIDTTSIQRADRNDVWFALGQFHRMFLYPLLLAHYRGVDTKGYYLANLDGLDASAAARMLGASCLLRPGVLWNVWLPAKLGGKETASRESRHRQSGKSGGSPEAQLFALRRLRKRLVALRGKFRHASMWSGYTADNTYTDESEKIKKAFVTAFMQAHNPCTVTDLGCNTGDYTRIAAAAGAQVTAVDLDHDCIDVLYRSCSTDPDLKDKVRPLWTNISNPTPAIGLENSERPGFHERQQAEALLALALVHHLLVTGRTPLPALANLLAGLTDRWLVVEYVGPGDDMFDTLSAFREDLYRDITAENFVAAFSEHFHVNKKQELPGGSRVLFLMEKKATA